MKFKHKMFIRIFGRTEKGIKKYVIKKNIAHQDYKDTLQNNKQIYHAVKTIRSVCHQLGSFELNKILLYCFEDKRYILADGKTSNAYRHCKTDSHIS